MRGFLYDAGSRLPIAAPPKKPPIPPIEICDAYVELAVRSNFSFLRGGSSPEALVRRAAELGYAAIALTDYTGLYGVVRAMLECEELGSRTKMIVGCEVPLAPGADGPLLHVENHAGYTHLCELLSEAHENGPKLTKNETAHAPAESIARRAEGLWCTAPASVSREALATLKDAFGARMSLGVFRHLDGEDARRERETIAMSRELDVPIVAHNAVRFAVAEHKPVLDVLHCIRRGITLDDAGRELLPNAEARIVSPREMVARFADHPDWIARTRVIAAACKFSMRELKYKFPYVLPAGETADSLLRRMTYEGAKNRYGSVPESVRATIEKELALIAKLEVATYFLSVREIVDIARARDILCQGRGSAANSAVCFCLGITAVDPASSSLLFERFLSAERKEPPDIDVDFEHERREEVIQEIYARYGRKQAAMVSEVICYRGKSALREVGKVFGFSLEQVERLSSIVSWWDKLDAATLARLRDSGLDPGDARVRHCLAMAAAIQGYPRHLSIHVGGFVLSAEPLERIAPVEPATMKDRTVVPWDKDDIDALGFFKVDVLGLGMLTAIRKALRFVLGDGEFANDQLARIPREDPAVYEALGRADSVGVFQIESRAQMAMLPRLRPKCFYDLVIEVAIVRPGPIQGGMVHPYLRRRNGEEPVDMPHAILRPILERTLGVPLFQEQVMQLAIVGAGYSGGEADQLRRDMAAWRRNGKLTRHRERLHRGFAEHGIGAEFSERIYKQIQGFGEYGFPESHAASFAQLVYASAWLKVHHPAAFAAALVNSQPMGFYSPSTIFEDAKRHGVGLLPIRVNYSNWDCELERGLVRIGLRLVRGLGEESGRRVEENRPYASIEDLRARAKLDQGEMDALAEAGALEDLVLGTRNAMWSVRAPRGEGLFRGVGVSESVTLAPLSRTDQLVLDFERTGLSIADHPMLAMRPALSKDVQSSVELAKMPHGARVTTAGLVICRQRPGTASGIVFMTLEDEHGFVNLVLWAKTFERHRRVATASGIVLARGKIDSASGVVHVIVEHIEKVRLDRELPHLSRDFH
ncbi:MAG TPA: error-prone DNA polymerase [Polyangiaceae bacterium]|jgi:error-prone DNA polymerase